VSGSSDPPVGPDPVPAADPATTPVTQALFTPDRDTTVETLEGASGQQTGPKTANTLNSSLLAFGTTAIAPWLAGPAPLATLDLIRTSSPSAPASAGPDDMPGLPGAPSSGGSAASASGGGASSALYALLLAFAALAPLRFDRLQLRPVRWRCAAFVALLERPG
jgi:hypothetical protein